MQVLKVLGDLPLREVTLHGGSVCIEPKTVYARCLCPCFSVPDSALQVCRLALRSVYTLEFSKPMF